MKDSIETLVARIDERTKGMKEFQGQIDKKLDNHITTVGKVLGTHDKRIRALETRLAWILGAGAAGGAVAGIIAAAIFRVFMGGG